MADGDRGGDLLGRQRQEAAIARVVDAVELRARRGRRLAHERRADQDAAVGDDLERTRLQPVVALAEANGSPRMKRSTSAGSSARGIRMVTVARTRRRSARRSAWYVSIPVERRAALDDARDAGSQYARARARACRAAAVAAPDGSARAVADVAQKAGRLAGAILDDGAARGIGRPGVMPAARSAALLRDQRVGAVDDHGVIAAPRRPAPRASGTGARASASGRHAASRSTCPAAARSTSARIQACISPIDRRFANGCVASAAATPSAWTWLSMRPGIDRAAAGVDHARLRPDERADVVVRSDGDEAAVANRPGPWPMLNRSSTVRIFAVEQDEIGGRRADPAPTGRRRTPPATHEARLRDVFNIDIHSSRCAATKSSSARCG